MAFGRRGYLTCHYCGTKSPILHKAGLCRFVCSTCDATNHLDEHGDITDPPASSQASPPKTYYAAPSHQTGAGSIFCEKCIKNQHLFTASLAQYYPDDPDDPEFAQREKEYYSFRKRAEKRYPQVCAVCEPRVLAQIDQAGYTARTDHLRRVIERSKDDRTRKHVSRTPLDFIDMVGWLSWQSSWAAQLLWHITILARLWQQYTETRSVSDSDMPPMLQQLSHAFDMLPLSSITLTASITATVVALPWNPRFVQTIRGFTRHVLGLQAWYTFQFMILAFKLAARWTNAHEGKDDATNNMLVAGHIFAMILTAYLYRTAWRTVRADTSRLFAPSKKRTSLQVVPSAPKTKPAKVAAAAGFPETMSEILDDIMASPQVPQDRRSMFFESYVDDELHSRLKARSGFNPRVLNTSNGPFKLVPGKRKSDLGFDGLNLLESTPASYIQQKEVAVGYNDEMDIDTDPGLSSQPPAQSVHRAFNTMSQTSKTAAFGATPVNENAGSMWFKVPPAPSYPAARLRNPPRAQIFRKPSIDQQDPIRFGQRNAHFGSAGGANGRDRRDVELREPTFFPKFGNDDDPLADMFGERLALRKEDERRDSHGNSNGGAAGTAQRGSIPAAFASIGNAGAGLASWAYSTKK